MRAYTGVDLDITAVIEETSFVCVATPALDEVFRLIVQGGLQARIFTKEWSA